MAKNKDRTSDPHIEFAKASHKHAGLPVPSLVARPEGMSDGNFVLMDRSVAAGQSSSIGNAFRDLRYPVQQIYLHNNQLSGSQLATLLRSLSDAQRSGLKSIVYGGRNELDQEAYEVLRDLYLSKRAPPLLELKLVDTKMKDPGILRAMLGDLNNEMRLQSLSLAKVYLDPGSIELVGSLLAKKLPSFKDLDLSWNQIGTAGMKALCQSLRGNQQVRSLSLAFNPVATTDDLEELGYFMRHNSCLEHLDLSGVLQTAA